MKYTRVSSAEGNRNGELPHHHHHRWLGAEKTGCYSSFEDGQNEGRDRQIATDFPAGKTASLKIRKEDGTIQEERTYPRSADPTKSKG